MITRVCAYCGAEYRTFPSIKPRYCSHACASAAKRNGEPAVCEQCGTAFYRRPSEADRRYCSKSCARTAANLTERNPSFARDISGERNPMYGKEGMRGEANPMYGRKKHAAPTWKGGRKQRADGYVLIVAPDDHPYPAATASTGLKYILEHRWVMERYRNLRKFAADRRADE